MYKCLPFERHILFSPILSGERWPHGPKGENGNKTKANHNPGPQNGLIKRERNYLILSSGDKPGPWTMIIHHWTFGSGQECLTTSGLWAPSRKVEKGGVKCNPNYYQWDPVLSTPVREDRASLCPQNFQEQRTQGSFLAKSLLMRGGK